MSRKSKFVFIGRMFGHNSLTTSWVWKYGDFDYILDLGIWPPSEWKLRIPIPFIIPLFLPYPYPQHPMILSSPQPLEVPQEEGYPYTTEQAKNLTINYAGLRVTPIIMLGPFLSLIRFPHEYP
jgi:hypothetical protein